MCVTIMRTIEEQCCKQWIQVRKREIGVDEENGSSSLVALWIFSEE